MVWVGQKLVLATRDVDIHVIVKSQGETDVLLVQRGISNFVKAPMKLRVSLMS
jgi:hypothetical protein